MELLKELRELTGAGITDVKAALDEAGNDKEKAIEILRKKGQSKVLKKADRVANEGIVESYIHAGGKVGVLLELNTETDFVARTDDFKGLAKEIALHIAASNPLYVNISDVPAEVIEKEKEIYKEQAKDSGKPDAVVEKMIEGKLAKYYEETCLMEQAFVKDPEKKIKDLLSDAVAKLGENIVVRRFTRYHLGN
ncbi:MAG: elongation factor T [Candidatus Doudnabacteria bacterium Gr01-1014_77]|uniref:Elongation factor Ts n=1 Tax=Candidatus Doudnabacteria bacterium Gr01-1014_77 TaxID=2017133 RepID=A0A554J9Y1_9BACT|nr:MAG: elongation factor T [Candidatus Doudnabacteria bacterium Gr01-1014_77]